MYQVESNIAIINGQNGIYDGKINNSSVRYGRNAISNNFQYLDDFRTVRPNFPKLEGLAQLDEDKFEAKMDEFDKAVAELDKQKFPPVQFECRYSELKDGKIDTLSLIAASYEEMGATSIPTKVLNKRMKNTFTPSIFRQFGENIKRLFKGEKWQPIRYFSQKVSANAIDLNKDKKIDLAEYATTILVSDALGSKDFTVDGVIRNEGEVNSIAYAVKKNARYAKQEFRQLYDRFNLGEAQKEFLSDKNNLIK